MKVTKEMQQLISNLDNCSNRELLKFIATNNVYQADWLGRIYGSIISLAVGAGIGVAISWTVDKLKLKQETEKD